MSQDPRPYNETKPSYRRWEPRLVVPARPREAQERALPRHAQRRMVRLDPRPLLLRRPSEPSF